MQLSWLVPRSTPRTGECRNPRDPSAPLGSPETTIVQLYYVTFWSELNFFFFFQALLCLDSARMLGLTFTILDRRDCLAIHVLFGHYLHKAWETSQSRWSCATCISTIRFTKYHTYGLRAVCSWLLHVGFRAYSCRFGNTEELQKGMVRRVVSVTATIKSVLLKILL